MYLQNSVGQSKSRQFSLQLYEAQNMKRDLQQDITQRNTLSLEVCFV